ncbi:MAG: DUF2141 domain-containing protein [Caulobacter sp.]|nr:DUF2141 domain-containing protein [Caulobacter sp.]
MTTPRIKTAALFLSIATLQVAAFTLIPLGSVHAQEPAPDTASVTVTFTGIQSPTGAIMAGVYDSETAFAGGAPMKGLRIEITGGEATVVVTGLKPGQYGIKAYHDIDGDGRMGTNPFGMPTEPYAASNNARGEMGPPAWADAVFEAAAGETAQTITID